ncbi:hypothetical protein XELAEV_18035430mg [Xenopus laevis]|uniref:Uncharacterized protein n=1 Tax=Xenopus laevis TaxID=8355 RepID=A0A974CH07_XENLA|nr:hypothetical protein XELAEV_18035430mg [Xenopus laevis]
MLSCCSSKLFYCVLFSSTGFLVLIFKVNKRGKCRSLSVLFKKKLKKDKINVYKKSIRVNGAEGKKCTTVSY